MKSKILNFISLIMVFIVLSATAVFSENDSQGYVLRSSKGFTFEEMKQKAYEYEKNKPSFFGVVNDPVFENKYGEQLDENSLLIYNVLDDNFDKLKNGKEEIVIKLKETVKSYSKEELSQSINMLAKDCFYALGAFDYDKASIFWINYNNIYAEVFYLEYPDGHFEVDEIVLKKNKEYDSYYLDDFKSADEDIINSVYDELYTKIDEIVAKAESSGNKSIYDKLKYFNRWLVDNNEYNRYVSSNDKDKRKEASKLAWTVISGLLRGNTNLENKENPVCEGYARAFKMLCNKIGVECILVGSNDHMWNYVKMEDGNWYAVDVTWNDPIYNDGYIPSKEEVDVLSMKYFLVGQNTINNDEETFISTHKPSGTLKMSESKGFVYPYLQSERYEYREEQTETTTNSYEQTETTTQDITDVEYILGDADGNGKLDLNDASLVLEYVLNNDKKMTDIKLDRINMKGEGEITAYDVACILKIVLDNKKVNY